MLAKGIANKQIAFEYLYMQDAEFNAYIRNWTVMILIFSS